MKKIFLSGIFCVLLLSFGWNVHASAASNEDTLVVPMDFTEQQVLQLKNLGFSDLEISQMSEEEYAKYSDLEGTGTVSNSKFLKVITDNNNNQFAVEVSQEEAELGSVLKNVLPKRSGIQPLSYESDYTIDFLRLTTWATNINSTTKLIKTSFEWYSNPSFAFKDVLGQTFDASGANYVPNSENFVYSYTDGIGTHNRGGQITKSPVGLAVKFDLAAIGSNAAPHNHNGYLSYRIQKDGVKSATNAYGHYSHLKIGWSGSIQISSGAISLGIFNYEVKAPDTAILTSWN